MANLDEVIREIACKEVAHSCLSDKVIPLRIVELDKKYGFGMTDGLPVATDVDVPDSGWDPDAEFREEFGCSMDEYRTKMNDRHEAYEERLEVRFGDWILDHQVGVIGGLLAFAAFCQVMSCFYAHGGSLGIID